MERWQNKVAVVTGASSGIGAAIVKDFVASGLIVVGLARRQHIIEEFKNELTTEQQKRLHAIKCDVSQLESVTEAFDWIEMNLGGIDILVNSAGYFLGGQLSTKDVHLLQNVLQTHVMGPVYCTQRAFKSMKARNFDGHVILMNSIYGNRVAVLQGMPNHCMNVPAKHALTAINEILRQEFNALGTKIKVTSISPGAVDTDILHEAARTMLNGCWLKTEDIVQCVRFAISTPPHVQIQDIIVKPIGEML